MLQPNRHLNRQSFFLRITLGLPTPMTEALLGIYTPIAERQGTANRPHLSLRGNMLDSNILREYNKITEHSVVKNTRRREKLVETTLGPIALEEQSYECICILFSKGPPIIKQGLLDRPLYTESRSSR
ncbi:hypothetical protein EVAR_73961_1, partial [Eumeta japonica]